MTPYINLEAPYSIQTRDSKDHKGEQARPFKDAPNRKKATTISNKRENIPITKRVPPKGVDQRGRNIRYFSHLNNKKLKRHRDNKISNLTFSYPTTENLDIKRTNQHREQLLESLEVLNFLFLDCRPTNL